MYHLVSTGFTAVILYLISYFFCRIGYYSLQLHRKIWNTVLASAFLLTAMAGLFLALQVNYKWNITFVKTILKWHVEFGIGMALTGIFHLLWHINYYGKLFNKAPINNSNPVFQHLTASAIKMNLFIIGFVSSSIQFLMLREIMNITGGYELISGSFLASWLIASATGASLAGRSSLTDVRKINFVFSFSPIISVLLMLSLSRIFLHSGETPSFFKAIIYTFLTLLPFCLVSGFTFIKLISIAKSENNFSPGKSFSIETSGGIAAGLVIAILTAGFVNTYTLLILIILLSICYVLVTYSLNNKRQKIAAVITAISIGIIITLLNPGIFLRNILLPGIKVITTHDTPYGNITTGVYNGEESLYYNQRLLEYADDAPEREEDIHYAMLQCDSPKKVIIISGSLNSHLPELMKYNLQDITYIERDPALATQALTDSLPSIVHIINMDAFKYMKSSAVKVDAVILLAPPPSTLLLNRFYTTEFFHQVSQNLNPGGIFMCSPGPGDNYYNKESVNLNSSLFNSLAANFKYVKPVGGNKLYFIASDMDISLSFCSLTVKRGITNIYVCSDYLEDTLILRKSSEISLLIDRSARENSSSFPVACLHSQSYQFSKSLGQKVPAGVLMFLIFALPVASIARKNLMMYFCASALAGFEIITLLTLQLLVGNMYQLTGLIIAGLMAGLSAGSGMNIRILNRFSLKVKVMSLLFYYFAIAILYNYSIGMDNAVFSVVVIMFAGFIPAVITGNVFRELTLGTESQNAAPAVYSADLAGSALGFIIISGIAVPVIGIQGSVLLLSVFILTGLLFGKRI